MNTVPIYLDERIVVKRLIDALVTFGMRAVYDGDRKGLVVTVDEPVKPNVVNLCEHRVAMEAVKS